MERKSVYVLIRESKVNGDSDFKVSLTCYADKEKAVAAMRRAFNKKVRELENDCTGIAHIWGDDDCYVSSYEEDTVDTISWSIKKVRVA